MYQPSISFCIISNGLKPRILTEVINSIERLAIPDKEIFVGGSPLLLPKGVIAVDAQQAACEGRLGEIRNKIIERATKDIIVVCDDDIIFEKDFYLGICSFGPDFDFQCTRILNMDGSRYWDWAVIDDQGFQYLIPYDEESPYVYITGGLCIFKRKFVGLVEWPRENRFYENEDVEFTKRIRSHNFSIRMNKFSSVTHKDIRMTQYEDRVMRLDMPSNWQIHKSSCFLFGVNSIQSQAIGATSNMIIDVPTHLYHSDLCLSMVLGLKEMSKFFESEPQIINIYNQGEKLGSLQLDAISPALNFEITLPQSNKFTRLEFLAKLQLANYWVVPSIHRSKQSYFVNDLELIKKGGNVVSQNDLEFKRFFALHDTYDLKDYNSNKKGLVFNWPLVSSNPYTLIMRSIVGDLCRDFLDVGITANALEISFLDELKKEETECGLWQKLLGNVSNPSVLFDLIDTSFDFGLLSDEVLTKRAELTSVLQIAAKKIANISLVNGIFGIEISVNDAKVHLPLIIDEKHFQSDILAFRRVDSRFRIGIEFETTDLLSLAKALHSLVQSGIYDKEILIFENVIQNELSSSNLIKCFDIVCESIGMPKELKSSFILIDNIFSLKNKVDFVSSLDLFISCSKESDFTAIILPLMCGVPVLSLSELKDSDFITENYTVQTVKPSNDLSLDSSIVAINMKNMLSQIVDLKKIAKLKVGSLSSLYSPKSSYPYWKEFILSLGVN